MRYFYIRDFENAFWETEPYVKIMHEGKLMEIVFEAHPSSFKDSFKILLSLALLAFVLVLLVFYIIALPLGLELFLFERLSTTYTPNYPILVKFYIIQGEVSVGHIFTSFILFYILCFILAFRKTTGLRKLVKEFLSKPVSLIFRDFLFALPFLSSLTYVAVVSVHFLEVYYGIPIGKPPLPEDALLAYYLLLVTPLIEEVIYRILPIGVFLAVRVLSLGKRKESILSSKKRLKTIFTSFINPDDAKGELGLKTVKGSGFRGGISHDEWLMILFTSVFFASSHYLSTGTWMVGKTLSTFIQGLVMGLSYLVYGVQAPILIHWFFNYCIYTYNLASIVHPSLISLSLLNEKLTIGLGTLGILIVGYSALTELAKTGMLNFRVLLLSAQKLEDEIAAKSHRLLSFIRRLDSLDLAALALTFIIFFMRLAIVYYPRPEAGESYYETGFVFDESYYVQAARKMLAGEAFNNEHPPLSKVFIMLGISMFGDNPFGWRIFPIIASSMSIILIYQITFLLSKRKFASFFAALLFATDIMAFNIGQICLLDAPSMLFVLGGTILILKRRFDLGGLFLGLASLCKLSVVFTSAGIVFYVVVSNLLDNNKSSKLMDQVSLVGRVILTALVTFLIGLWIYDTAYGVFSNNPLTHIAYIYSYHDSLKYQNSQGVILPLEWINPFDPFSPTAYHVTTIREMSNSGVMREYHPIAYYGLYTPLWWSIWIILPLSLMETIRKASRSKSLEANLFAFLWIIMNFFPYVLLGYFMQRWVYPFYFYLALPGLYIDLAYNLAHSRTSQVLLLLLTCVQLLWFFIWFPVKPKIVIDLLLSLGLPA